MDDIVRQAMVKWPNVPHCHGWLRLDARGDWRMRDERAQAAGLPGDKIRNPTLLSFINRNYLADDKGRWYFQNGPQRVYVDLEISPLIVRTDPPCGFVFHTGATPASIDRVFITAEGDLVFDCGGICGVLDNRDLTHALTHLQCNGEEISEDLAEKLLAALMSQAADAGTGADAENRVGLQFAYGALLLPLMRMNRQQLAAHFHFVPRPQPELSPAQP